jgi:hypothetical protein
MEIQAFLLCDSVVQDAQSGKSFVHGVFDRIWVKALPAVHRTCAIFFRIRFEDQGQHNLTLLVVPPSGLSSPMPVIPITVGPPENVAQGVINIEGLPIPEEGRYEIELLIDDVSQARYILHVIDIREQSHGSTH